jgi:electron transfer flavoprotein beta subunit
VNILVLLKMVPDVVEELEVDSGGISLNSEYLRMIVSESDDHALEEALILKERHGGTVSALALDAPEVDDALYSALAKGVDQVVKITGVQGAWTTEPARALCEAMQAGGLLPPPDLIMSGTQAIDDLDGLIAPLVSQRLGLPFVGIVTGVKIGANGATAEVVREFPSGVRGEYETPLPAVLGIQAAEKPPRYVPVAKVRAAMKSTQIGTFQTSAAERVSPPVEVLQMTKPVSAGHAEMIEGTVEQAAERVRDILAAAGAL